MAIATISGISMKDPEVKDTGGGKMLKIRVSERTYNRKTRQKETIYWDVVTFGQKAEILAPHLFEGQLIVAVGEISCEPYTKKDGSTVVLRTVYVQDNGLSFFNRSGDNGGNQRTRGGVAGRGRPDPDTQAKVPDEDDIPF